MGSLFFKKRAIRCMARFSCSERLKKLFFLMFKEIVFVKSQVLIEPLVNTYNTRKD